MWIALCAFALSWPFLTWLGVVNRTILQELWTSHGDALFCILTPFIVTIVFGDYVAGQWNAHFAPHSGFAMSLLDGTHMGDSFDSFVDRNDTVITAFLVLLSATAAIGIPAALDKLEEISNYAELDTTETTRAKRLRHPAKHAIDDTDRLDKLYTPVNIETWNPPTELPQVAESRPCALLKIFLSRHTRRERVDQLQDLLQKAERSLSQSLFVIYAKTEDSGPGIVEEKTPGVIAYGTGIELRRLYLEAAYRENFRQALAAGDEVAVSALIRTARQNFLASNPKGVVLLSTVHASIDDDLNNVLAVMGEQRMRRILLTSKSVPLAHGILGLDDVCKFVYR